VIGKSSSSVAWFEDGLLSLLIMRWKGGYPSSWVKAVEIAHRSSSFQFGWCGVIKPQVEWRGLEAEIWRGPER